MLSLPPGVKFDFAESTFAAVNDDGDWPKKTRFLGRGTADNAGTAVLKNSTKNQSKIADGQQFGKNYVSQLFIELGAGCPDEKN